VKKSSNIIKFILEKGIKPSEDVQVVAINNSILSFYYIIDKYKRDIEKYKRGEIETEPNEPSEKVQIAAVEKNAPAIEYIIDNGIEPSEDVQLAAVKQDGELIEYIIYNGIEPSERVQLASVEKNPSSIKFIENPHPSVIEYVNSLNK
jgi:ribosomal protein S16